MLRHDFGKAESMLRFANHEPDKALLHKARLMILAKPKS
jgi:hypothetical protein